MASVSSRSEITLDLGCVTDDPDLTSGSTVSIGAQEGAKVDSGHGITGELDKRFVSDIFLVAGLGEKSITVWATSEAWCDSNRWDRRWGGRLLDPLAAGESSQDVLSSA